MRILSRILNTAVETKVQLTYRSETSPVENDWQRHRKWGVRGCMTGARPSGRQVGRVPHIDIHPT